MFFWCSSHTGLALNLTSKQDKDMPQFLCTVELRFRFLYPTNDMDAFDISMDV